VRHAAGLLLCPGIAVLFVLPAYKGCRGAAAGAADLDTPEAFSQCQPRNFHARHLAGRKKLALQIDSHVL
jgi:hypothetical protein